MSDGKKRLHVTFNLEPVENKKRSREEGRPIFEDVEFITIRFPGDKHRIIHERASEKTVFSPEHGRRISYAEQYPEHYAAFKRGIEFREAGTPLEELPFISASKRQELKALEIHTAETLVDMPHRVSQRLGMGAQALINQAKAYLEKASGSAVESRLAAENAELKSRLDAMAEQVNLLMAGAKANASNVVQEEAHEEASSDSPFADWQDADIRAWIKDQGGDAPGPRTSHANLVKAADELNEKLRQEAEAA